MAPSLARVSLVLALAVSGTGCAALFAGKTDNIHICPAAGANLAGLTVTDNGMPVQAQPSSAQAVCPGGVMVVVDRRVDHTLAVTNGGKVASFEVGTGGVVGWFLLDLFLTGPIGIIVDWSTHAWRSSTPVLFQLAP